MIVWGQMGFPVGTVVKNLPANAVDAGLIPGLGRCIVAGKFHGQRSLAGYSPWGCKESDTIKHNRTHKLGSDAFLGYVIKFNMLC